MQMPKMLFIKSKTFFFCFKFHENYVGKEMLKQSKPWFVILVFLFSRYFPLKICIISPIFKIDTRTAVSHRYNGMTAMTSPEDITYYKVSARLKVKNYSTFGNL